MRVFFKQDRDIVMRLVTFLFVFSLASCQVFTPIKLEPVASERQSETYHSGHKVIISKGSHAVYLALYRNNNFVQESISFWLAIDNGGAEPVIAGHDQVSIYYESSHQLDRVAIKVKSYADQLEAIRKLKNKQLTKERWAAVGRAMSAQQKSTITSNTSASGQLYSGQTGYNRFNLNSTTTTTIDDAQAKQQLLALNRLETQNNLSSIQVSSANLTQTLDKIYLKMQAVNPGDVYTGIVTAQTEGLVLAGGGYFVVTIDVGGEKHKFKVLKDYAG